MYFRWKRKQNSQEKDIAREKILLQRLNTRRQLYIEKYIRKTSKESARMQSKERSEIVHCDFIVR